MTARRAGLLAVELAALAGRTDKLAEHAAALAEGGRAQHLAELAGTAVYFRVLSVPLVPQITIGIYQQRRFRATPLSLIK
jgi:hypothetical protein